MKPATTTVKLGVVQVDLDSTKPDNTSSEKGQQEDYDIQIQGSDRTYPAVILRLRHRGQGATILTISKFGQHSEEYSDYKSAIDRYIENRQQRLAKADNIPQDRNSRVDVQGVGGHPEESRIDKGLQNVVRS